MKTCLASALYLFAAATAIGALHSQSAHARAPYKKEFEAKYVTDAADPNFVKAAEAAKCNICHLAGKEKKDRNPYGKALAKHLQKGDDKNVPKIQAALEEVAKERSDANKPDSPTFGERIKSGKLPGG
jgi:hypothetical protein